MPFDFDHVIDRRSSDSIKWNYYAEEVLPMWVADMDFASPKPIQRALTQRVRQGVFGYGNELPAVRTVIAERVQRLYNWSIDPDAVVLLPGLVCGLNVVSKAVGDVGDGVLINTPVYGPFQSAPVNQGRTLQFAEQPCSSEGSLLHYDVDVAALEAAIQPNTRLFILCNPHNPTGRAFTRPELTAMAAMAERHNLVICSDEIHCDLLMGKTKHTPIAALDPAVAERTITLMAPSKTFNVPGLGASFAIVPNPSLRKQVQHAASGIVPHPNLLGLVAMLAAYTECDGWLKALCAYLTANRDFVVDFVTNQLPGVKTTAPEATYLAWLDCREAGIEGNAAQFFMEKAKVAVNDGAWFGHGGAGFVRLNFGCPRATLADGLERMRQALVG